MRYVKEKFGVNLVGRPQMITVRGRCAAKDGRIHRHLLVNEASLAGKLVHPHIVQIYDAVANADPHGAWVDCDDLNDFVNVRNLNVETQLRPSVQLCGGSDAQQVVISRAALEFEMRLHQRQENALFLQHSVRHPQPIPHQFRAPAFKPFQRARIVERPHLVRFTVTNAQLNHIFEFVHVFFTSIPPRGSFPVSRAGRS